jgi:hypothetical protein
MKVSETHLQQMCTLACRVVKSRPAVEASAAGSIVTSLPWDVLHACNTHYQGVGNACSPGCSTATVTWSSAITAEFDANATRRWQRASQQMLLWALSLYCARFEIRCFSGSAGLPREHS